MHSGYATHAFESYPDLFQNVVDMDKVPLSLYIFYEMTHGILG